MTLTTRVIVLSVAVAAIIVAAFVFAPPVTGNFEPYPHPGPDGFGGIAGEAHR